MDDQNPYQSPAVVQASDPSPYALRALRTTRRTLWSLMAVAILFVPYSILTCIGSLWAAQFFDDSRGYYTGGALLELTAIPVACVCTWQFFRLDRALRTIASSWQIEPLLLALKRFVLTVSVALVAYWLVLFVGSRALMHPTH